MRLNDKERLVINSYFKKVLFETQSRLFIFGSRVDDYKKGGDIDLLILAPENKVTQLIRSKNIWIYDLQGLVGEQRIDITVASIESMDKDEFLARIKDQLIELIELK